MLSPLAHAPDGSYRMSLALRPEHLGDVEVHLELADGRMSVHLVAPQAETREALRHAIPDLRAELMEQGIQAGDLDVSDTADRNDGRPSGFADASPDEQYLAPAPRHGQSAGGATASAAIQPLAEPAAPGRGGHPTLDVLI
jgi:uncharacterized membrane protein YccC